MTVADQEGAGLDHLKSSIFRELRVESVRLYGVGQFGGARQRAAQRYRLSVARHST